MNRSPEGVETAWLLEANDLTVSYGSVVGLRNANFRVARGECVAILGNNGAGKSSLLKGVSRLTTARGSVLFEGKDLLGAPPYQSARLGIGLVPEGRQVFGSLTVEENLLIGAHPLPRRLRHGAVEEMFQKFPLLREKRRQEAETLSGGQQQILAIARAVISKPKLVLLDEPSLGLAPILVESVFQEIRRLADEGMTLIVVEQLAAAALAIADRGYVLENGIIALEGDSEGLRAHPEVARRYLGVREDL